MADDSRLSPRPSLDALLRLAPLVAVLVLYGQTIGFDFINYDDNVNVYANPLLQDLSPGGFLRMWTAPYEGLYIPLTYSLWGVLAKISSLLPALGKPLSPPLFHAANVVVHGINATLVASLLRRLFRDERAALAGALLFALHPLQVEAVAWVSSMRDLLSGLFSLLSLWLFVCSVQETGRGRTIRYLFALLCYGAALLAKPGAVVVPLLAAAIGFFLLRLSLTQLAVRLGAWVAIAVPVVLITKVSQPETVAIFVPPLWQRLLVAGDAISFYAGKLVFPWTLSPDYGRTPQLVVGQGLPLVTGLLPWAAGAVVLGWCRSPGLLAGVVLFVGAILPVSGVLPFSHQALSTVADRYLYLALLGPALTASSLFVKYRARRLVWWGAIVVLGLCATRSAVQILPWRDSLSFNRFVLESNPRSWTAATNLGVIMAERQQLEEAARLYRQAIALNPGYFTAYYNLGVVLAMRGGNDRAAAAYQKAIETGPYFFLSYNNLCNLYLNMGRGDQAVAVFQQAVRFFIDPQRDPELTRGISGGEGPSAAADDTVRALMYNLAGRFTLEMNRPAEAIPFLTKAVSLDPGLAEAYNNLGSAYAAAGQGEQARAAYQRAADLLPNAAEPYNNLCLMYNSTNRGEEAIAACQQAIAKNPGYAEAYFNLGNAYRLVARNQEAAQAYTKVLELAPGHFWAAFNLAGTYEAMNNASAAISLYRRTIQMNPDFAEAYNGLGLLLDKGGQSEEAMAAWQKAVTVDPSFAAGYLNLARGLLRQGETGGAETMYRQAKRLGVTDPALENAFAPRGGRQQP